MTNRSGSAEMMNSSIANMMIDEDGGAVHHHQQQDYFKQVEEILAQDEEEEGDDDLSLHDYSLQEKLERLAYLEKAKQSQDEYLETMQRERLKESLDYKQQVYWLLLELGNTRREKVASEERMAELYQDLMHQEESTDITGSVPPVEGDSVELLQELQAKVHKYEHTFGILDNQMNMVKTSCDQVVKTLKEEIADLMDDRCRMEMDLLNQLAATENEKRNAKLDLQVQIRIKNETIARLQQQNEDNDSRDVEELEDQLAKLRMAKKDVGDILRQERAETDDHIESLEEANAKLEQMLETAADDLEVMRSSPDAKETAKALDQLTKEREEIVSTLERTANIWEKADASVQSLEDVMDKLRPTNETDLKGDRARLLSTLELASLVQGQVKVSLLLVELKMRNQLTSLKNDKIIMAWAAPTDQEVTKQMQRIQKDATSALTHIEGAMSEQMLQMEERTVEETKSMKQALEQRTETLQSMQQEHKRLKVEISRMKKSTNSCASPGTIRSMVPTDDSLNSPSPIKKPIVSGHVLEQLEAEVLNVVERVQHKNNTIQALQANLKEYAIREQILMKELKRAMRGSSKPGEATRTIKITKVPTPLSPPKKSPLRVERKKLEVSAKWDDIGLSPLGKPKESVVLCKTPVTTKSAVTANLMALQPPSVFKTPVTTPKPAVTTKTISPLPPSPRELLSKPSSPKKSPRVERAKLLEVSAAPTSNDPK
jgi:hypothetical protein